LSETLAELRVALLKNNADTASKELSLSKSLNISLLAVEQLVASSMDYYLRYEALGLSLFSTSKGAPGAVRVDFSAGSLTHRLADDPKHQNLVRAVGLNKATARAGVCPSVLDATAGLGKDAFLLAMTGCSVLMLERSRIVHAMLADGLDRALASDKVIANTAVAEVASRLSLRHGDLLELGDSLQRVDVVYLDPMFPARRKSARVKKDMFLLQGLLGHEENKPGLLQAALKLADNRVVVKRGKLSPALGARTPDVSYKGRNSRYDVYLVKN